MPLQNTRSARKVQSTVPYGHGLYCTVGEEFASPAIIYVISYAIKKSPAALPKNSAGEEIFLHINEIFYT